MAQPLNLKLRTKMTNTENEVNLRPKRKSNSPNSKRQCIYPEMAIPAHLKLKYRKNSGSQTKARNHEEFVTWVPLQKGIISIASGIKDICVFADIYLSCISQPTLVSRLPQSVFTSSLLDISKPPCCSSDPSHLPHPSALCQTQRFHRAHDCFLSLLFSPLSDSPGHVQSASLSLCSGFFQMLLNHFFFSSPK